MTGKTDYCRLQPRLPQSKLIELRDVTVRYDRRVALDSIDLAVDEGDFVAITGPNGGGKTTLLRVLLRLMKPTHGEVIYRSGGAVTDRLAIGYLPQKNMIDSRFPISVREVIASGLIASSGMDKDEIRRRVDETVELVGLEEHVAATIGELSGGQLQRALLGRAIIARPRVLVLDEPLSYVDKRFESRIYEIVAGLASHTTILLVSHEMSTIAGMANRHLIIDRTLRECRFSHHYARSGCDCADL